MIYCHHQYSHYNNCMNSFDFCQAPESSADHDPVENLGQVVFGERLRASPYNVMY